MSGVSVKPRFNRRRLAFILIFIGCFLTATASILFLTKTDSSYDSELYDATEEKEEMVETLEEPDTVASTEETVDVSEKNLTPPELDDFTGDHLDSEAYTFMMLDGSLQQEGEVPAFHTVSSISSKVGKNPKTNEDSNNLLVILSALPDREMNIAVLVSVDDAEITGTRPDFIQGVQWILTYSGGVFKKTERLVIGDGPITQLAAEDFNIRFTGNEVTAEVEFFGPLGTQYYAVMIYDETYSTLIRP